MQPEVQTDLAHQLLGLRLLKDQLLGRHRFGDSGGSQQGTPRFWRPCFSGGRGRKVTENESEGQPLWWRSGRMSGKDPETATEDADKTGGQKVHHLSGRFAWSCQVNGD